MSPNDLCDALDYVEGRGRVNQIFAPIVPAEAIFERYDKILTGESV